jgi:hypothetical protein
LIIINEVFIAALEENQQSTKRFGVLHNDFASKIKLLLIICNTAFLNYQGIQIFVFKINLIE